MKKTFTFDLAKNDFGAEILIIEVCLSDTPRGPKYSVVCTASTRSGHELYGGQCMDTFSEFIDDELFAQIMEIHSKYHCNAYRNATPKQAKWVHENIEDGTYIVDIQKELENVGLLVDDGHTYYDGTYYLTIPNETLIQIKEILAEG